MEVPPPSKRAQKRAAKEEAWKAGEADRKKQRLEKRAAEVRGGASRAVGGCG